MKVVTVINISASAIALAVCISVVGCAGRRNLPSEVVAYPEVPPVGRDVDYFLSAKPPAVELQYLEWVRGPGSTNPPFQRWLVKKLFHSGTNNVASLSAEYAEWASGPGRTNAEFQKWLAAGSRNRSTNSPAK